MRTELRLQEDIVATLCLVSPQLAMYWISYPFPLAYSTLPAPVGHLVNATTGAHFLLPRLSSLEERKIELY